MNKNIEQTLLKYADGINNNTVSLREVLEYHEGLVRENIPVGFLRQWINEDRTTSKQKLVSNEDIIGFIDLGYK